MSIDKRGGANRFFQAILSRLGKHELATLMLIAVVAGGTWGFAELADEVFEGDTQSFDQSVLISLRSSGDPDDPVGPQWVEEFGRDITALGGVAVLTALTLTVAGFLWLRNDGATAVFLLIAVASGMLLSAVMKQLFDRPRPDLIPHGAYVYTTSFPSGHSAMAAITYLTLGALLARVQRQRRTKAYLVIIACLVTCSVGVSRVYLGVHWPTDVFAGWTIGATWAAACWLTLRWFQRSGRMQEPDQENDGPDGDATAEDDRRLKTQDLC